MRYRYTDKEVEELLKSLTIIIDSREQKDHVEKYLNSKDVPTIKRKLNYGDYSAYIPKNEALGIVRDITLEDLICIERKADANELATNFTKGRHQIENEFIRCTSRGCKMILLIEGSTYSDILHGNYRSEYKPKSFVATLKSFQARYNLSIEFIDKKLSPNSIYYTLYYYAREILKYGGVQAI